MIIANSKVGLRLNSLKAVPTIIAVCVTYYRTTQGVKIDSFLADSSKMAPLRGFAFVAIIKKVCIYK